MSEIIKCIDVGKHFLATLVKLKACHEAGELHSVIIKYRTEDGVTGILYGGCETCLEILSDNFTLAEALEDDEDSVRSTLQ